MTKTVIKLFETIPHIDRTVRRTEKLTYVSLLTATELQVVTLHYIRKLFIVA